METYFTYGEISRQPETWRETIDMLSQRKDELLRPFEEFKPEEILLTGCGSSYFLSIAAAYLFQEQTGISAKAVPASDILIRPTSVINKDRRTLVIGSSRSGNTTELVRAMDVARKQPSVRTLGLTTAPDSQLAQQGEAIILPHVQEKSVVMTGSYTNMLLTLQLMAGWISGAAFVEELKRLPELGQELMAKAEELGKTVGGNRRYDHFIYLGQGSYFGMALEGMLKMKEMTQLHSEAFNPLEFRHGPISILHDRCCVILLSDRALHPYRSSLIEDLRRLKAEVVLVGEDVEKEKADIKLDLGSGLSDPVRGLLAMPLLHYLAYYRTQILGLNPDRPRYLSQVVVLEDEEG